VATPGRTAAEPAEHNFGPVWHPESFLARWRRRREELAQMGAIVDGAKFCDLLLADLDLAVRVSADEHLPLTAAAAESGYSVDHLRRLVREGRLENVGSPRRVRLRRADLPRKHRRLQPVAPVGPAATLSRRQIAQSIVNSNT
jgi:hypothetical protein